MKNIGINKPCSENWNEMSKNEQGAFCQKCASQVYDFTKKSSLEIKQTLLSLVGKPICGRITNVQEIELNEDFNRWMNRQNQQSFQSQLLFALLFVFGLGLFSCENKQDEQKIKDIQTSIARIIEEQKDSTIISTPPADISKSPIYNSKIETDLKVEFASCDQKDIIVGKMDQDFEIIEFAEQSIEGGMSYSREYENYLIEEVTKSTEEFDEHGNSIPKKFEAKVFPNPAQDKTTFEVSIPFKSMFEISLYDLNGKMIQVIRNGELNQGKFRQELDLIDLVPGMYLIIINSTNFKQTVRFSKI